MDLLLTSQCMVPRLLESGKESSNTHSPGRSLFSFLGWDGGGLGYVPSPEIKGVLRLICVGFSSY